MNIVLNNKEQIEAVEAYLTQKGFDVSSYDVNVKTIAGRGDSGTRIEVELNEKTSEVEEAIAKPIENETQEESEINETETNEFLKTVQSDESNED